MPEKSAYETSIENGFKGTSEDFWNSVHNIILIENGEGSTTSQK